MKQDQLDLAILVFGGLMLIVALVATVRRSLNSRRFRVNHRRATDARGGPHSRRGERRPAAWRCCIEVTEKGRPIRRRAGPLPPSPAPCDKPATPDAPPALPDEVILTAPLIGSIVPPSESDPTPEAPSHES